MATYKNDLFRYIYLSMLVISVSFSVVHADPVIVTMIEFNRAEEMAWQRAVVERFNALHTDIQVDLISQAGAGLKDKMLTMLVAGTPIDIGYHDPHEVNLWGRQGIAKDLMPYLERESETSSFKEFFPSSMDLFFVKGRQYGIPIDLQTQAFFYNEQALDEAGVAYPGPDWTWHELADWGRMLSLDLNGDGNIDRWAMRFPQWYHWMSIIWSFGADIVDDHRAPTRFAGDTVEMRQALEFMTDLTVTHKVMAPWNVVTGATANNLMREQNIAMTVGNSLYMQTAVQIEAETGLSWNVTRLPFGPTGTRPALINSLGWFIFEESARPDAAWEVIRYFSSQEAMSLSVAMRGTIVPHRTVAVDQWPREWPSPENRNVFIEAINEGVRGMPNLTETAPGLSSVLSAVREVISGEIAMPQAFEHMRLGIEVRLKQQEKSMIR